MTNLISLSPIVAYLDPGTGSFLLQVMIAGLLSGAYMIGQSWRWFRTVALAPLRKHD